MTFNSNNAAHKYGETIQEDYEQALELRARRPTGTDIRKFHPSPPDEQGRKPYRCFNCDRVLMLSAGFTGSVQLKCRMCKLEQVFTPDGNSEIPFLNKHKQFVAAPGLEQILETMELRWEQMAAQRAMRQAKVAVGLRFDVFCRDKFRCIYCGASAAEGATLHADHVIPASKGGPTTLDNLVTACIDCNLGKSNKTLSPS